MSKYIIFISCSSLDEDIVKLFSNLIKRVSLNQIDIWFSNDKERNGGISTGQNWYTAITENIEKSSRVIAFITENSIDSPWLTYETGYADGLKTCDFLPVRFGVTIEKTPAPLKTKHISGLNSVKEMHSFLDKLLNIFDITYDREAFEKAVNNTWADMRTIYSVKKSVNSPSDLSIISSRIENLEKKLDAYLGTSLENPDNLSEYKYDIEILLPSDYDHKLHPVIFAIDSTNTVEEVLNEIYYSLNGLVRPFSYLESWVLIERSSQTMALISDIQDHIPANCIFSPNTQWEVQLLDESDSLLSKTRIKLLKEKLLASENSDNFQLEIKRQMESDNAKGDCWYDLNPDLYKEEITTMNKYFPQFELRKLNDGRIAWIGDISPGNSKNKYTLLLAYDNDFPANKNWDGLIRVYIVKPDPSNLESVF